MNRYELSPITDPHRSSQRVQLATNATTLQKLGIFCQGLASPSRDPKGPESQQSLAWLKYEKNGALI